MKAITVTDPDAGTAGMQFVDCPKPNLAENDVLVRVHAAGFTPGELEWPGTWSDRSGRTRTPSIPGHEFSGTVADLGLGTTGFTIGQRVFGLGDWTRNGALAEFIAVEARNLAPLPADIDFATAAAIPIAGLTAQQGIHQNANVSPGQTVLIIGVAGSVGNVVCQMANEIGAFSIGAGRTAHFDSALNAGASKFLDIDRDELDGASQVDVVFDTVGGTVAEQARGLVRPGGLFVSIVAVPEATTSNSHEVFFIVEPNRTQLQQLAHRVRTGSLYIDIANRVPLHQAPEHLQAPAHRSGKTIFTVGTV